MADILVLYYSHTGAVKELANHIARGVESVAGMSARVRTVPKLSIVTEIAAPPVPESGARVPGAVAARRRHQAKDHPGAFHWNADGFHHGGRRRVPTAERRRSADCR